MEIFAVAVGIASMLFMLLVFIAEGFFGHGIYFMEPNIYMARFEFSMVLAGLFTVILFFIERAKSWDSDYGKDLEESNVCICDCCPWTEHCIRWNCVKCAGIVGFCCKSMPDILNSRNKKKIEMTFSRNPL